MGRVSERDLAASSIRQIIDYEPETGSMWWKVRDRSLFARESDWRTFNKRFAGKRVGNINDKGYYATQLFGRHIGCHRAAWAHYYGEWPDQIDHVNGDRTDNRIANLRNVSHRENSKNRKVREDNRTGQTGVYEVKGRWVALINTDKGRFFIGRFKEYADAVFARKIAEKCFGYHENHGRVSP